jgi:apolipoprotein D and lipocalin family protein
VTYPEDDRPVNAIRHRLEFRLEHVGISLTKVSNNSATGVKQLMGRHFDTTLARTHGTFANVRSRLLQSRRFLGTESRGVRCECSPKEEIMSDVKAISSLDLKRYLGRWYEIALLPIKYEDEHASDVTANYSINPNGKVRVDNRCFDEHDKPTNAVGEADPVDGTKAKLKVSFLPAALRWIPFTDGDYWVLKIDLDYQIALVGTPDHKFLWVLARESSISEASLDEYLAEARRQGFDLQKLIRTPHTGREVSDTMLESG